MTDAGLRTPIGTVARSQAQADPTHLLDAVRDKIASTSDPVHLAKLRTYLRHMEAEFAGDIDEAMHTLVAEPRFRFWCGFRDPHGPLVLRHPTIRANYQVAFGAGFPPVEIVVRHFIVSDDGLVIHGEQLTIVDGLPLSMLGIAATPGKQYHLTTRFVLLVEFEDGLMIGEDHYWPLPHIVNEIVEDTV